MDHMNTFHNTSMKICHEMKCEIQEKIQEAEELRGHNNNDKAISCLEKIQRELLPKFIINKGEKLSDKNAVQEHTNKEILYLSMRGYILYEIEDYVNALKCYEGIAKELADDCNHKVKVHKTQGDCLRKLGRYDEARKQYKMALMVYEDDTSAGSSDKAAIFNSCGLTHMHNKHFDKALSNFKEATKCSTKNPLYYCNKGNALNELESYEKALQTFKKAKKLVDDGEAKVIDLTDANMTYIKKTLQLIVNIDQRLSKTRKETYSKIQEQLIEALNSCREEYILVEKSFFDILIRTLYSDEFNIYDINRRIKIIESSAATNSAQILNLKGEVTVLQNNYQDLQFDSRQFKCMIDEQFKELSSLNEVTYNMFDNKFRMLEIEVIGIKDWKVEIDSTLTKANLFVALETQREYESLKNDYGDEVYEYATSFYEALSNSLQVYRMISTGYINGKSDDYTGIVGKVSKGLSVANKILASSGAADVSQSLSIAGGIINIVNGFYKEYSKVKLDRITKKIVDSISGSLLEKDLNLAIASSAIKIAIAKKDALKVAEKQESKIIKGLKKWISDKIEVLATEITKTKGVPQTNASKMALKDVSLFIINCIIRSNEKLVVCSEDVEKLGEKIKKLFMVDVAIKQLFTDLYENTR